MTAIFKSNKDSNELALLMDRFLRADVVEQSTNSNKIEESVGLLVQAANMLESLNETQASEAITVLIEKIASKNV